MAGHLTHVTKIIQVNLNHCAAAQELMFQNIAQWGVGLAIVAEPYCLPGAAAGSDCKTAAIIGRQEPLSPPITLAGKGKGWVAFVWGNTIVMGGGVFLAKGVCRGSGGVLGQSR